MLLIICWVGWNKKKWKKKEKKEMLTIGRIGKNLNWHGRFSGQPTINYVKHRNFQNKCIKSEKYENIYTVFLRLLYLNHTKSLKNNNLLKMSIINDPTITVWFLCIFSKEFDDCFFQWFCEFRLYYFAKTYNVVCR